MYYIIVTNKATNLSKTVQLQNLSKEELLKVWLSYQEAGYIVKLRQGETLVC